MYMRFNSGRVQLPRDPNLTEACNLLLKSRSLPGLLLFIAGAVLLMGIITAEIFYPDGYTTAHNEISDLGATRPPDSVSFQLSASILNTAMIIGELLILAAALVLFFALVGTGILGVGLFPGNNAFFQYALRTPPLHLRGSCGNSLLQDDVSTVCLPGRPFRSHYPLFPVPPPGIHPHPW